MTIPYNPVVDEPLVNQFKDAMAQFPTGVSIVTTLYQGKPIGVTVSSLTSLSLNPPLVLICLGKHYVYAASHSSHWRVCRPCP